eukprot:2617499-Rhodomonas_salina.1
MAASAIMIPLSVDAVAEVSASLSEKRVQEQAEGRLAAELRRMVHTTARESESSACTASLSTSASSSPTFFSPI